MFQSSFNYEFSLKFFLAEFDWIFFQLFNLVEFELSTFV